jgi:hypothetical protein
MLASEEARSSTVLLTGPFGGLTDDVRGFLLCLADDGLPLTGWGDLDPAGLRLVRERLPGGGALGDSPEGLALARRRATLLRSLCDAGRLAEERDGALQLTALGRGFLDLPAAATAMAGPHAPASLGVSSCN